MPFQASTYTQIHIAFFELYGIKRNIGISPEPFSPKTRAIYITSRGESFWGKNLFM
jgi:hypothetical protein